MLQKLVPPRERFRRRLEAADVIIAVEDREERPGEFLPERAPAEVRRHVHDLDSVGSEVRLPVAPLVHRVFGVGDDAHAAPGGDVAHRVGGKRRKGVERKCVDVRDDEMALGDTDLRASDDANAVDGSLHHRSFGVGRPVVAQHHETDPRRFRFPRDVLDGRETVGKGRMDVECPEDVGIRGYGAITRQGQPAGEQKDNSEHQGGEDHAPGVRHFDAILPKRLSRYPCKRLT